MIVTWFNFHPNGISLKFKIFSWYELTSFTSIVLQKTEVLWCGLATGFKRLSDTEKQIAIGDEIIQPAETVRNLGIQFDSSA